MTWLTRSALQLVSSFALDALTISLIGIIEDEMDVSALNLGMIAAYYNISCKCSHGPCCCGSTLTNLLDVTIEVYTLLLKERMKLKGLLEIVSSSADFEPIPIRRHEDVFLRAYLRLCACQAR